MARDIIYLDNAATTKIDDTVAEAVLKTSEEIYGNASSQHSCGKLALEQLEKSREKIAKFIGAKPSEIIFTSGGTESDNLTILGLASHSANKNKKHIITSVIEHPAVLESCKELEKRGYEVDYVGVDEGGIVNLKDLEKKIRKDTLLVSVMHVNNEIGTIQPIEEIGKICKSRKVYFHSDCVQSFKKLNINVSKMNLDMVSVSGHKINGPKGVGFLYVRTGVKISPIIFGGGHENGLRSGTENIPGIVGLATALDVKDDKKKIEKLRNMILDELLKIHGVRLNGSREKRIYNNINVSFYGVEGESLMLLLDKEGICVSTGSACSSHKLEESHVLKAIGVDKMYIHGSIRITIGDLAEEQTEYVIGKIKQSVKKLGEISPFKLNREVKNV